ncbi:DUF6318 family protein [Blastococcus sp. CT_GayMR16]|uniref:DUF6318 family protein n=1 Tax=Blastococcus sp. CT_GayMR16 TaxID=2559607 RepID=UPI00107332B2|nr:DUF6318 family protein [Blastococcus sp. CT_GayMR16]TFV87430.1 hypothetical protein E4P38_14130 [Blastococcus sp. CT_GayMR16]
MRDLRWAIAGLVVGTTLLSGCSEKVEANDTLPLTSAAETTEALPDLGPADFPVPDDARTKDAAGAEAFLRYWIDLLNHQRPLLDSDPLRALGPECRDCLRIADNYDEAVASSQRYEGGELTLNDVTEPQLSGDEASITFGVRQEAVRLVDAAGNPVDDGLPVQTNLGSGITLLWSEDDQSWLVSSVTLG